MRLTTAAAAVSILLAIGVATWWPGDNAPPLVAHVQAQVPNVPGSGLGGAVPKKPSTLEESNAATQAKLASAVKEASFAEEPLAVVLRQLADAHDVQFYINRKALEAEGVMIDAPITLDLKNVRLETVLDLVLQQAGENMVDYFIRDGVIIITGSTSLESANEVKAYPVGDLLRLHTTAPVGGDGIDPFGSGTPGITPGHPGGTSGPPRGAGMPGSFGSGGTPVVGPGGMGGMGGFVGGQFHDPSVPAQASSLMNVITSSVAPETWLTVGGRGTITYFGDMLIIRQNARTHREVEKVLTLLRETAGKKNAAEKAMLPLPSIVPEQPPMGPGPVPGTPGSGPGPAPGRRDRPFGESVPAPSSPVDPDEDSTGKPKLVRPEAPAEPASEIRIFSLSFAKAKDVSEQLAPILKEKPVAIAVDARTNSLLIRADAETLLIIEAMLAKIDQDPAKAGR